MNSSRLSLLISSVLVVPLALVVVGAAEHDVRVPHVLVRADVDRLHRTAQPEPPPRPDRHGSHDRNALLTKARRRLDRGGRVSQDQGGDEKARKGKADPKP